MKSYKQRETARREAEQLAKQRKASGTKALRAYLVNPIGPDTITIAGQQVVCRSLEDISAATTAMGAPKEVAELLIRDRWHWHVYTLPHFQLLQFATEADAKAWAAEQGLPVHRATDSTIFRGSPEHHLAEKRYCEAEQEKQSEAEQLEAEQKQAEQAERLEAVKRKASAAERTAAEATAAAIAAVATADSATVIATRAVNTADDANELAKQHGGTISLLIDVGSNHAKKIDRLSGIQTPAEIEQSQSAERERLIGQYIRAGRTREWAIARMAQIQEYKNARNQRTA